MSASDRMQSIMDDADPLETASGESPLLTWMSDVEPEDVEFLWDPFIPLGKFTLLEGDPGVCKTFLALNIAAAVTQGWSLPGRDGRPGIARKPANVLYLTAEDGLGDTLRPRLDSAGAAVDRVCVLCGLRARGGAQRPVSLQDLEALDLAIGNVRPELVVIDPIQGFLGSDTDMHRANEVRPVLSGIGDLAQRHGFAALAIRHLRKSSTDRAAHRGLGSIDFAAFARSMILAGHSPEGERAIVHVKSSLVLAGSSLAFEIEDGRVEWRGTTEIEAADLSAPEKASGGKRREAEDFLAHTLAGRAVPVKDLRAEARDLGVSWRTVEDAKKSVGAEATKLGMNGGWAWFLPEDRKPIAAFEGRKDRTRLRPCGLRAETPSPAESPINDCGLRGDEAEEGWL